MSDTSFHPPAWGADDPNLTTWVKDCSPFLLLPPPGPFCGWRDPFLIGRPGRKPAGSDARSEDWTIMIGSGITGVGGTALVYRTSALGKGERVSKSGSWTEPVSFCNTRGYYINHYMSEMVYTICKCTKLSDKINQASPALRK